MLPRSQAPGVVCERDTLDRWIRHAVLWGGDQECLWTFVDSTAGRDDLAAWKSVLASLPFEDPRRSLAAAEVGRLRDRDRGPARPGLAWPAGGLSRVDRDATAARRGRATRCPCQTARERLSARRCPRARSCPPGPAWAPGPGRGDGARPSRNLYPELPLCVMRPCTVYAPRRPRAHPPSGGGPRAAGAWHVPSCRAGARRYSHHRHRSPPARPPPRRPASAVPACRSA